jgi:hypothetical protein
VTLIAATVVKNKVVSRSLTPPPRAPSTTFTDDQRHDVIR